MNILVTGAEGQLGSCFRKTHETADISDNYYFVGHNDLDITNMENVRSVVKQYDIDVIINCAAYTNVDGCETDPETAFKVNSLGPMHLAYVMKEREGILVHISTDYVYTPYEGWKGEPFTEEEAKKCKPENTYGATKRYGEIAIENSGCRYLIIRTSWLYSVYGKNFVKKVMELVKGDHDKVLRFVTDQIGTPTNAAMLAFFVCDLISSRKIDGIMDTTLNFTANGVCSWYDFADFIRNEVGTATKTLCKPINPCYSEDFVTPAKRPQYSVMSKRKFFKEFPTFALYANTHWQEEVRAVVKTIIEENK